MNLFVTPMTDLFFFLFFGCDAEICELIYVVFTLCCFKCRNWTSLKYWLLPTDGDVVLNSLMCLDLRSNTLNVPCPTCEEFQLYRCSVVRGAWCHKSTSGESSCPQKPAIETWMLQINLWANFLNSVNAYKSGDKEGRCWSEPSEKYSRLILNIAC